MNRLTFLLLASLLMIDYSPARQHEIAWMKGGNSWEVFQVIMSGNGKYVVTVATENAKIWSTESGGLLKVIRFSLGYTSSPPFVFSRDGELLYYADSARILCLNILRDSVLRELRGHKGTVYSLDLSADGNTLLSGGMDSTCIVWDLRGEKQKSRIIKMSEPIGSVVFAGGSNFFFAAGYTRLSIVDSESGAILHAFKSTGFSSAKSDTTLAIVESRVRGTLPVSAIGIYDWKGRHLKTHAFMKGALPSSFSLSSSGRYLIICIQGGINVLDSKSGKVLTSIKGDVEPPLTVSSDERFIAARLNYTDAQLRMEGTSYVGTIGIWDLQSGVLKARLPATEYMSDPLTFSDDCNYIVTADNSRLLRLWDVKSGTLVRTFTNHTAHITQIVSNNSHDLSASLSDDGMVLVWKSTTGQGAWSVKLKGVKTFAVNFSTDGRLLVLKSFHEKDDSDSEGRPEAKIDSIEISLWDAKSGELVREHRLSWNNYCSAAIDSSGHYLYIAESAEIQTWDMTNGMILKRNQVKLYQDFGGGFSPRTNYLVYVNDPVGNVLVRDLRLERELFKVQAHEGFARTISWPFDEKILVTSGESDNCIKVWEIPSGRLLKTVRQDVQDVHYASVSPSGRYFAGSGKNGTVTIWDLQSEKKLRSYSGYPSVIWSISWSPDEELVYSGHWDGTIVAWETGIRN